MSITDNKKSSCDVTFGLERFAIVAYKRKHTMTFVFLVVLFQFRKVMSKEA